jgi:Polysaccharide pyruvyl transferase.
MEIKRKVGGVVIMHSNHNNYGTSLQGFATVRIVQKLGYSFRIIRYHKKRTFKEMLVTIPGLLKSGALVEIRTRILKRANVQFRKRYAENLAERTSKVNKFKMKYFDCISDFYTGYKELQEGSLNYDVIFVGSDQVWGPLSLYAGFYNLLFVDESVPEFSYASSFGVSEILPWQIKGTKEYLEKLDAVGVREQQGKDIVDRLSKHSAKVVADPTMLLSREEWSECISESTVTIDEPYILSYVLGSRQNVRDTIMKLGKETGLKVVCFRHMDWYVPQDECFGDIPVWKADPLDFVKLLSNAEYICTDSFHGTVFSALFQKKFVTFYRQDPTSLKSTHSRIDNLLNILGLESRLASGEQSVELQMKQDINYILVDKRIKILRDDSLEFLTKCLNIKKS